jgi:hypothetical protein
MKAKHTFKYTQEEGGENFSPVEVTFEIPTGEVTITEMLYNFECYLKACGFVFDGHLEIYQEDVCADTIDDTDYCCTGDSATVTDNEWLEKIQWVHGMCNPPSPDWKKNQ